MVDLEIEDADGTPEGGVSPVSVNRLLISLVCLVVLLAGHVRAAEQVPTLRIGRI